EITRQHVESVRGMAPIECVAGIFAAVSASEVLRALSIVDEVAAKGTSVGDFLDQLISFGRDLMILAATGSADGASAYGPARAALQELGKTTSLETALLFLDVLVQARTRVRSRALSNPLVALEMAIARLAGLGGIMPLSEILSRLDSLPAARPTPGGKSFEASSSGEARPEADIRHSPRPEPPPVKPVPTTEKPQAATAKAKLSRHPVVDRIKSLFDGVIVHCETNENDSSAGKPASDGDGQEED
ncbi:MAG: hypothetical protein FWG74_03570, partial [Planctomycetes bacterium]|nr:hypothetical protein [Planctomycetota bacterium]